MGFGATPSKVNAEIEKCGTIRQLQNRVIQLEQLVEKLIARPGGSSPVEVKDVHSYISYMNKYCILFNV